MTFSVNSLRKKTTQHPVAIIIGRGENECPPVSCVHTKIVPSEKELEQRPRGGAGGTGWTLSFPTSDGYTEKNPQASYNVQAETVW